MSAVQTTETTVDADVEQIRRLVHEYSRAIDTFQLTGVVGTFADDAVWDMSALGAPQASGIDQVRAAFAALIDSLTACCHFTTNHLVDVDGDTATGTVYCHAFAVGADGSRAENLVLYSDDYTRTAKGWKFQRRTVTPLMPAAAPAE
ncbi:nuclear transport factor 2 family protein [Arthrobacter sp. GCM10027362]|uniref:nuclear transport factor 2 family protein n=1 Tax=Arthrobacter sp. GCM10027362 TaxID=3273379 RepID=UPI0036421DB3